MNSFCDFDHIAYTLVRETVTPCLQKPVGKWYSTIAPISRLFIQISLKNRAGNQPYGQELIRRQQL
jgi:hypothetical protein